MQLMSCAAPVGVRGEVTGIRVPQVPGTFAHPGARHFRSAGQLLPIISERQRPVADKQAPA